LRFCALACSSFFMLFIFSVIGVCRFGVLCVVPAT
jgi:hypothetical protein